MNEEIILQMIKPYEKDNSITYDEFEGIFNILTIKEHYSVVELLFENGINLVDAHSDEVSLELDDTLESTENDFEILYEDSIFRDNQVSQDNDFFTVNTNIKQSNENLCYLIQQGNKQAEQDLCIKNKKLVDKYVMFGLKKFRHRLEFEDLEQVGFCGLIKAAQKFDASKETLFSTYAVWWIKQQIIREILDHGYAIRVPVHMHERVNKVLRLENSLSSEIPIFEERISRIADELGLEVKNIRECLLIKNNVLTYSSLNVTVGEGEDTELGEFVPIEPRLETDEVAINYILQEQLQEALHILKDKEQMVIRLRFGLDDGIPRTLEEVGKVFDVTRERIRQIEAKALRKLAYSSKTKDLKDYLF